MTWLAFGLSLFGLNWAFTGIFRQYILDRAIMIDRPNQRSSHNLPTPRGGGAVFFFLWLSILSILHHYQFISAEYLLYFSPVMLVGLIGLWDDYKSLSIKIRFAVQFLAAYLLLHFLGQQGLFLQKYLPIPTMYCTALLTIGLVWMTNLYNFMDGSDGLAGVQAVFIFGMGSYLLFSLEAFELATLAFALVALIGGFLVWNWPLAKIFMGDSGSYFLGFSVGIFALVSYQLFTMPLITWALLSGVFCFDATVTLIRRLCYRQSWREAHREHAYQRLLRAGFSHQKVLLGSIALNSLLALLAYESFFDRSLLIIDSALAIILLTLVYLTIELIRPMQKKPEELLTYADTKDLSHDPH